MGWNNTEFDPDPDCPNRSDPEICPDLELCPEFEFPAAGAKFRETASDLLREFAVAAATGSVSRGRKRLRGCLCCRRSASLLDVLLLLLLLMLMLLLLPVFLFLVVLLPLLPRLPDAAAAAAVPVTPHR